MDERSVAGVKCSEVLAELSEFSEGALDAKRTSQFRLHLAECQRCARFGAVWGKVLSRLRAVVTPDSDEAMPAIELPSSVAPREE